MIVLAMLFLVVLLGFAGFVAALSLQFAMRRYTAVTYWLAVVMVGVFGTMAADVLHVGLHVPYAVSTPVFTVALAVVLAAWYTAERTLSIHSIRTRRREFFYWATVLATFALGTAAENLGDEVAAGFQDRRSKFGCGFDQSDGAQVIGLAVTGGRRGEVGDHDVGLRA